MTYRMFASTILLLAATPAVAQPSRVPILKVDPAVFLNDVVVIGSAAPAPQPQLAITEEVNSAPVSVADLTAGLVSGTTADAEGKIAVHKQIDAELDRVTRAVRYDR